MFELMTTLLATPIWWSYLLRIALVALAAWIVHRLSERMARRILHMRRMTHRRAGLRNERLNTLQGLVASSITFATILLAILISLRVLGIAADTIIWVVGLFAAGLGLGARPLVSDFLTGVGFLFDDPYDVGEKVELLSGIQGIVEEVTLRTTTLRSSTGEIYAIPNGEVRVVRNFSRGRFSVADITLKIPSADLERTLTVLKALNEEAMNLLPNLLEPWQVLSEEGVIGEHTALTLVAKARFGRAAEMRPRLLALVHKELAEAGISLVN